MNTICAREKIEIKLLEEIKNLTEEDIQKIDNNTHEIKIKVEKIRKKENHKTDLTEVVMMDFEKQLNGLITREKGIELLLSVLKDKLSAEYFAKYMRVSFLKQDSKDYIINKIVEATIGAKLRSNAIKGQ
jgi:hypothetical protein